MKNIVKFGLVVFTMICFALVFTACDDGGGSGSGPKDNVPGKTFVEKLAWLNENAEDEEEYFITAGANENIERTTLSCNGATDVKVTIRGGKVTITDSISMISADYLFTVKNGITLILKNITLQGQENARSGSVYIDSGGTLIMETGTKINYNRGGSGVRVRSGGTFVMNDGEITRCGESGVYVYSGGTFTMNGGKIFDNSYTWGGGGGVYISGGTVIMNGGAISGNSVGSSSGLGGGGVCLEDSGTFAMNGGTISGNSVTATLSYPPSDGGGVSIRSGTFIMDGGEIFDNKAVGSGGGVSVNSSGTFRISNGTIYGQNAADGKKNIATGFAGGGAALWGTAQYGTLIDSVFTKVDDLSSTNDTIKVVDGVLQ